MDKYRLIARSSSHDTTPIGEVRVTSKGNVIAYVQYARKLLLEGPPDKASVDENEKRESGDSKGSISASSAVATTSKGEPLKRITIRGIGGAMTNAVLTAEMLKRKVPGLHQMTEIGTTEFNDIYEPLEEGLDVVYQTKKASHIAITLCDVPTAEDLSSVGYQKPLTEEEMMAVGDDVGEHSYRERTRFNKGRFGRRGGGRAGGNSRGRGSRGRAGGLGRGRRNGNRSSASNGPSDSNSNDNNSAANGNSRRNSNNTKSKASVGGGVSALSGVVSVSPKKDNWARNSTNKGSANNLNNGSYSNNTNENNNSNGDANNRRRRRRMNRGRKDGGAGKEDGAKTMPIKPEPITT